MIYLKEILRFLLVSGLLLISFVVDINAQSINIYVATSGNDNASGTINQPVRTLRKAQQLLRRARKNHPAVPITVYLYGGTYYLDSTLVFTPKDNSVSDPTLTFKSFHHEKVIISGARPLTLHWLSGENGVYKAKLPAELKFDQLYVNEKKQVMARYPNYDSSATVFHGISKKTLSPERIRSWHHPAGGLIHAMQKYHWGSLSYRIVGKSSDSTLKLVGGVPD
jgi:hypothetical protein